MGNHRERSQAHVTPAGWYFGLVSQMIYRFLVGLSLWKWLLFTFCLFKLSRLDLKLVATHPDHHGGIGFLGPAPMVFAPVAFVECVQVNHHDEQKLRQTGVAPSGQRRDYPVQ
jgi:hypothetical protein